MTGAPSTLPAIPLNSLPRRPVPAGTSFSLPPVCSGAALVLMMNLIGRAAPGDVITVFMNGLDYPHAPAQSAPKQVLGWGLAATAFDSSLTAASTLSDIVRGPVLTSTTPSGPTETVMLVPSATSM